MKIINLKKNHAKKKPVKNCRINIVLYCKPTRKSLRKKSFGKKSLTGGPDYGVPDCNKGNTSKIGRQLKPIGCNKTISKALKRNNGNITIILTIRQC